MSLLADDIQSRIESEIGYIDGYKHISYIHKTRFCEIMRVHTLSHHLSINVSSISGDRE